MKQYLVLAGKGLTAAGMAGIVSYLVSPNRTNPTWPYVIFIVLIGLGIASYLIGQRQPVLEEQTPDATGDEGPATPAFTDRWRHTPNGAEVPGLMMITHKGFSHPGYMRPTDQPRPPFVRIGALVACDPLGDAPTTSDLRDRFLAFLSSEPVSGLIRKLTYVGDDLSWRSYASNGRINNEAVLTNSDDQAEAPVVSAMMILNEAGMPRWGHDERMVELVLHIEPRGEDGMPASPMGLRDWHDAIIQALTIAGAFVQFLSQAAEVATYDDPPTQLGIEFGAYHSIRELVDPGDIPTVAGSWDTNLFLGYMIAERDGKLPTGTAIDLLTRICDHALHLHGYETELAKLRGSNESDEAKAAATPRPSF